MVFQRFLTACLTAFMLLVITPARADDTFTFPVRLDIDPFKWPKVVRSGRREAWLYFSYTIDADGKVRDVTIDDSNGIAAINRNWKRSVESAVFEPATLNGRAVDYRNNKRQTFTFTDYPRAPRASFVRKYKRAVSAIKKGNLAKAAATIKLLQDTSERSLQEELYLQKLLVIYTNRTGDTDNEYLHIGRAIDFIRGTGFEERETAETAYMLDLLVRSYQIELKSMMLGDAFESADSLNGINPNHKSVQQVLAHAASMTKKIDGKEFWTTGKLVTPLYGGEIAMWKSVLLRHEIRLQDVVGDIDTVEIACTGGKKKLNYPITQSWIFPKSWERCRLVVEGGAGTTFVVAELLDGTLAPPQPTAGL